MPIIENMNAHLNYEVHGDGYPVFFIHGGGGNTMCWFQQVPYFAKKYKVITVDLRGFKKSICDPELVHPRFFANDIRAIMDAEGIKTAGFVCQSLGAWAGLPLAVQSPERVACLFVTGSPTPAFSEENWAVLRSSGDIYNSGRLGGSGRSVGVGWNREIVRTRPELTFLYSQIKLLNGPFDARTMQDDIVQLHPSAFANYQVPTMVAGGAHDDFLTPTSHLHVASLIPGAHAHTFANAGHSAYFETPDEFNPVVDAFLRKHLK
ncbi:alpha/beta fold hydrolase [Paraburkholderia agricolaris]|uniref:alpha/beta fold hydrolase n=1 Tax=Paraburkholderia agricolaris TaxID=2152888 RepID=UPI00129106E6|nr:alpha/beta hydrolase [Paraburkholderia agricolaris]